jgi:A/G-specific adenine glycosylase
MMTKKEQQFIATVWDYYRQHGRRSLPWRRTKDPYKILVSEIMLQQTQVDRVKPKYEAFLKQFPSVAALASAQLKDVLIAWQGLGYNRRAKMLHSCAIELVNRYHSKFPKTRKELVELPGVGPYTAGAIMAFAFNLPEVLIETNIRSVYLHHFFNGCDDVTDQKLFILIEKTLSNDNPREWYAALMDYGTFIKKEFGNPNTRSAHHAVQSIFKGSDRQIRGAIIRLLAEKSLLRTQIVQRLSAYEDVRVDAQLEKLKNEGMIMKQGSRLSLL